MKRSLRRKAKPGKAGRPAAPYGGRMDMAEQVLLAGLELDQLRRDLRALLARLDATAAHLFGALHPPTPPPAEAGRAKRAAPAREQGVRGRRAPVLPGTRGRVKTRPESTPEAPAEPPRKE